MSLPIWGSVLWRRAIWAVMGSGLPDSACCFCCTPSRQPISVAPVNCPRFQPQPVAGLAGLPAAGVLIFTLLGGAVVCIGTALVDLFNRFLFSAKIVFLAIMLALLMPHIHQVNLLTLPVEQGLALSAIPVIFTSFGFHGSVPSIVSYLGGIFANCAGYLSSAALFLWWPIFSGSWRRWAVSTPRPLPPCWQITLV